MKSKCFGVYFDGTKTTSGQRFFRMLFDALCKEADCSLDYPSVMLFNVSAPISKIVKAKLRRQKIVVRIDGLYFDRLSERFISTIPSALRWILWIGLRVPSLNNYMSHLANFINQNYTAFARMIFADLVVYQSRYSADVYRVYFPSKASTIIVNGSIYLSDSQAGRMSSDYSDIELVTIYDGWKPAKRMHDLVKFVRWAREERNVPIRLTILGYTGTKPVCVSDEIGEIIENMQYIRTIPRFTAIEGAVREALLNADIYITFTYRDPCPNVVVEAMAHGLPVVAMASGGMPDIVGDAGVLLDENDSAQFFAASRYECEFPSIKYELILEAVYKVRGNLPEFREKVRRRFDSDLGIGVVAQRYAAAVRSLL